MECTKGYPYTFAKVVDTRTRLVEEIGKDLHQMGVFIDIFPIDGMGNQKEKAMQRLMKIIRLRSRIWEAALKKR
ncbi:LicD family protein [Sellimonas intestinalis]|uniref:LicD family protein n=1 Tax=Sellimonas intestinalis TaxID=1653434 RepID=UPI0039A29C4F